MQPTGPVISLLDDERSKVLDEMQNALSSATESQNSDIFDVPSDGNESRDLGVSDETNSLFQQNIFSSNPA